MSRSEVGGFSIRAEARFPTKPSSQPPHHLLHPLLPHLVSIWVVFIVECPSRAWMSTRSAPALSRWVTEEGGRSSNSILSDYMQVFDLQNFINFTNFM